MKCDVHWLGTVGYDEAWQLQARWAAEIAAEQRADTLLLLEHPHVYTLGRRGQAEHVLWSSEELAARGVILRWVDRGGDVTYHGPGQLVGYPLLRLASAGWQQGRLPQADFVGYVRRLERVLIGALERLGVHAEARPGLTGVWVGADKIASIGVKVDANGITRHGFALNVNPDGHYWAGIVPCGLEGVRMISLADLLTPLPGMEEVVKQVSQVFGEVFGYQIRGE
ncbi:MAG: lipoyl(octanoyl) transferase LipB [Anaerolinea sp.]|nr:lipoyl(octanoyl) transferase LipB [Anaerolinea sp.]